MLEVEVKARCGDVEPRLLDLGAEFIRTEDHLDTYFNSPWRDFRRTDEALRLRQVNGGFRLTYKGPRMDSDAKCREEFEVEVGSGVEAILAKLGFEPAVSVRKRRRLFSLGDLLVCLDEVEGLGSFVEVESSCGKDEEIFSLLEKLGISREDTLTDSYVELLEAEG